MPTADVKIYSAPWCVYCKRAKEFMKEKNIPYTDINVDGDQKAVQEMFRLTGQTGIPVIVIGKEIIIGFDPQHIESAYAALGGKK